MKTIYIESMHNTEIVENYCNSKQDISNRKSKIKIYKNMIKPDLKMHTIYIIYTHIHIIARY